MDKDSLIGKCFGDWEVMSFSHAVGYRSYWKCRCKNAEKLSLYVDNLWFLEDQRVAVVGFLKTQLLMETRTPGCTTYGSV